MKKKDLKKRIDYISKIIMVYKDLINRDKVFRSIVEEYKENSYELLWELLPFDLIDKLERKTNKRIMYGDDFYLDK